MKYYYSIYTKTFNYTYGFLFLDNTNILQFSHAIYLQNDKNQIFSLSMARTFKRLFNNKSIVFQDTSSKGKIVPYVNNNKRT